MHDVTDLHWEDLLTLRRDRRWNRESQAYPTAVLNNQLQAKSQLPC